METVLMLIIAWLSANFALPESHNHPRIIFMAPDAMQAERLKAAGRRQTLATSATPPVEAFYGDTTNTIYLPRDWSGNTPAELSVLVHEMVHHLQSVAGLNYACPQEREKVAYLAQDKWLGQFGLNLIDEFKLDAMTVLVRTSCLY